MIESLDELDNELKKYDSNLNYFYCRESKDGKDENEETNILDEIKKIYDFENIYYNKDYTQFALKRDEKIVKWGNENNVKVNECNDYLLAPMGSFLKKDGAPYEKYTPFKNNAKTIVKSEAIPSVESLPYSNNIIKKKLFSLNDELINKSYKIDDIHSFYTKNENILSNGGRENGLKNLKKITLDNHLKYGEQRNILIKPTTLLSPYIKFGCISIREVYYKIFGIFGENHALIDQLYWREFYYYIAYYFPRVLQGHALKEKYDNIKWRNNKKQFAAWKDGLTGFPVVDAGMRQLNETGYMHNRARLITSAILIKILNIDWKWGEKYFATQLIDYDPIVNNGNWQWGAGCGVDSQPYFRIFNPWTQAKDYDANCEYIKRWIPELKDVPAKDILKWDLVCNNYKNISYPKPIVDYKEERDVIMATYKKGLE